MDRNHYQEPREEEDIVYDDDAAVFPFEPTARRTNEEEEKEDYDEFDFDEDDDYDYYLNDTNDEATTASSNQSTSAMQLQQQLQQQKESEPPGDWLKNDNNNNNNNHVAEQQQQASEMQQAQSPSFFDAAHPPDPPAHRTSSLDLLRPPVIPHTPHERPMCNDDDDNIVLDADAPDDPYLTEPDATSSGSVINNSIGGGGGEEPLLATSVMSTRMRHGQSIWEEPMDLLSNEFTATAPHAVDDGGDDDTDSHDDTDSVDHDRAVDPRLVVMDDDNSHNDESNITTTPLVSDEPPTTSNLYSTKAATRGLDNGDASGIFYDAGAYRSSLYGLNDDDEQDEKKQASPMRQSQPVFMQQPLPTEHGDDDDDIIFDPAAYPFDPDPMSMMKSSSLSHKREEKVGEDDYDFDLNQSPPNQTRPFLLFGQQEQRQQQQQNLHQPSDSFDPMLMNDGFLESDYNPNVKRRKLMMMGCLIITIIVLVAVIVIVSVSKNNNTNKETSSSPLPRPPDDLQHLCRQGFWDNLREAADSSNWDACREKCQIADCCFVAQREGNANASTISGNPINSSSSSSKGCFKGNELACSLYYQACFDVFSTRINTTDTQSTPTAEPSRASSSSEPGAKPSPSTSNPKSPEPTISHSQSPEPISSNPRSAEPTYTNPKSAEPSSSYLKSAEPSNSSPTFPPSSISSQKPSALPNQNPIATMTDVPSSQPTAQPTSESQLLGPNVLFIISDQLRIDGLGYIQAKRAEYNGKLHVRTPNIDRLAANGVSFETAYCVSPSCGPARATLRTGSTLQRTGITQNKMFNAENYEMMNRILGKVEAMTTFEQLLVEHGGSNGTRYTSEYVGKFHAPLIWFYGHDDPNDKVIIYNEFDFKENLPLFYPEEQVQPFYQKSIEYLLQRDRVNTSFRDGQQRNDFSGCPYDPIQIDARFGMPTNSPLTENEKAGLDIYELDDVDVCGRDSLSENYTSTAIVGDVSIRSLDRLIQQYKEGNSSFILYASFNSPHPPMIATKSFFDYYHQQYSNIVVPASISDDMRNSEYANANQRRFMDEEGSSYKWNNPDMIQELTSAYYALIEEVDTWVGRLVDRLETNGIVNNTMIIFTADHGDMLGAHGFTGKSVLLEEATRVPLIMSFPKAIAPGTVVSNPVSHMDVFSTILDYLEAPLDLDVSDGKSLRRFIERENYNRVYDEEVVVVEIDSRIPTSSSELSGQLGEIPNFMVRKGSWKLMLPKKRDSSALDMMYNLDDDPYEMNNLLGKRGLDASNEEVGKAEYLKVLLMEWMKRHNSEKAFYSDNKWNLGEGAGDLAEIRNRRTWREAAMWQSETTEITFGPAVNESGILIRHEYFYVGRTLPGSLNVQNIAVKGMYARYFQVALPMTEQQQPPATSITINENEYLQIRVTYYSPWKVYFTSFDTYLEFDFSSADGGDLSGTKRIMLVESEIEGNVFRRRRDNEE